MEKEEKERKGENGLLSRGDGRRGGVWKKMKGKADEHKEGEKEREKEQVRIVTVRCNKKEEEIIGLGRENVWRKGQG